MKNSAEQITKDETQFKGTHGKWLIKESYNKFLIECDNPNWAIVDSISNYSEDKANILLISKAPEMLEMLQEFVLDFDNGLIDDFQIARDRFEKLIKEATEIK
jgi:hypothetical protein